jgi:hypothetical protein
LRGDGRVNQVAVVVERHHLHFDDRDALLFGVRIVASVGLGLRVTRTVGLRDTRTLGLRDTRTVGLRDTRTVGLRDTRTVGLRDTRTLGLRDTRTRVAMGEALRRGDVGDGYDPARPAGQIDEANGAGMVGQG